MGVCSASLHICNHAGKVRACILLSEVKCLEYITATTDIISGAALMLNYVQFFA